MNCQVHGQCCQNIGQFAVTFIVQFAVRIIVQFAVMCIVSLLSGLWSMCCPVHGPCKVRFVVSVLSGS